MSTRDPRLLVQPSPLLKQQMTTGKTMRDVIYALLPATLAAFWLFGLGAMLVLGAAIGGALVTEWAFTDPAQRAMRLQDGSAFLTGLLLGLTLPPALPLWMAFLGGAVSIGLGKLVWGGLGYNLFNPALVGRAFLLATFPTAMTTWSPITGGADLFHVYPANLAWPFLRGAPDAVTSATPLGLMKFEQKDTALWDLFLGNTAGSLGETSALLLLLGGVYLLIRRDIDWRIPAGILLSVAVLSGVLHLVSPQYPGPLFATLSGGLLLGAFYMATDPVTSPLTPRGTWVFAVGTGVLVVLIRLFGGFPEGIMYAILLMNACTPLIDRVTQPRVFGRGAKKT